MTESAEHNAWKNVLCGCGSDVEVKFGARNRIDCVNVNVSSCGEVELRRGRIPRDIGKLASMKSLGACGRPVLAVRPSDYRYASKLAASKGIEVVKATPLNLAVRQASCSLQLKRMKL